MRAGLRLEGGRAASAGRGLVGSVPLTDVAPPGGAAALLAGRRRALDTALERLAAEAGDVDTMAATLVAALRGGGKVLAAGNGGSAAEAQHFAAELVGRFRRERAPYAALALSADSAVLTALANDYGYAEVFARQVRAFGRAGDAFVAFSTSGESENLLRAAAAAREAGLAVLAVTGGAPNRLAALADRALRLPSLDTPVTQELHMLATHLLCELVEATLAGGGHAERG